MNESTDEWEAETCLDGNSVRSKQTFASVEEWAAWVDKNYPEMRERFDYVSKMKTHHQVGTDYRWSALTMRWVNQKD